MKIRITKVPKNIQQQQENILQEESNTMALGGDIQTHGGDFTTGMRHINAGQSHEENPYEGVQVGVDPEGKPNLVEEGEVIYNDYVYSNRIELDDEAKERFHFSKKQDITYADAAKKLEKEASERPNDPISTSALKIQMAKLAEEQERQKQEMQAEEAREAFAQLSPEEQVALMQQLQAQQQGQGQSSPEEQAMMEQQAMQGQGMGQPQMSPEEQAMMEQQMAMQGGGQPMMGGVPPMGINAAMAQQPMMAYGGMLNGTNMFKDGGALKWLRKYVGNIENIERVASWIEDRIFEYEKSKNITLKKRQRNKLYKEYYNVATRTPQLFAPNFDGNLETDQIEDIKENITPYQDAPYVYGASNVTTPSYDNANNSISADSSPSIENREIAITPLLSLRDWDIIHNLVGKRRFKSTNHKIADVKKYENTPEYKAFTDHIVNLINALGESGNVNDIPPYYKSVFKYFDLLSPYLPNKYKFVQIDKDGNYTVSPNAADKFKKWREDGKFGIVHYTYMPAEFETKNSVPNSPSAVRPPEVLSTSSGDILTSNSTGSLVTPPDTTETIQPVEKDVSIVPPEQEAVDTSIPRTYTPFSYDVPAFLDSVRNYNGGEQLGSYTSLQDYINDPGYKAFTDEIVNFLKDPSAAYGNGAIPAEFTNADPKINAYLQYLRMLYDKEPYFRNTLFTRNGNGTWNVKRGAADAYRVARNGMLGDQFYRVHLTPTYIDKDNESGTSQEPTGVRTSGAPVVGNDTTGAGEVQPVVGQTEVVQKPRRRTKAQMKADRRRAEKYNEEWFLNRAKELGMVSPDATKIEGFKHDQDNPDANLANFNNLYRAWQREQARDTYVKGQRKKKENELFDPKRGMYRYSDDKSKIYKYDIADKDYDYYIDASGNTIDKAAYDALEKAEEKAKYRHIKGYAGDRILDFDGNYKRSVYNGSIDELLDSYKDKYEEGFDWKPENASKLEYPAEMPHSALSDLRYVPLLTNAVSLVHNILNDPNYGRANSLIDLANSYVPRMVSPTPVYSGYTYNPKDTWTLANAANAIGAEATRALLNSGLTAGGVSAGLLTGAYNGILGMGENVQRINDYNDKQRLAKAESDLKTQQINTAADLQAQVSNQGAEFNAQQHRYQGLAAGNTMKDALDMQRNAAINTNWANLGTSAQNVGDEEFTKDLLTWLERTGVLKSNMYDSRSGYGYDYGPELFKGKYGGMLTKKTGRGGRR